MTRQLTALLNNPENLQPLLRRLPTVLSVVLLIACTHILSQITWMLLTDEDADPGYTAKPTPAKPVNNGSSQQAFRQLFDRYAPRLVRMLRGASIGDDVAQDLTQQTFLQMHRARHDTAEARRCGPG